MNLLSLTLLITAALSYTALSAPITTNTANRFDIELSGPSPPTDHVGAMSRLASKTSDATVCLDAVCKGNSHNYLFADIYVGGSTTPSKVILDTGSSDTWVTGSTCRSSIEDTKKGGCEQNEMGSVVTTPGKFNATGQTGSTKYGNKGDRGVEYSIYKTSVKFGTAEVTNFPIGVVTNSFGGVKIRGILGMAFNSLSKIEKALGGENASFLDALQVSKFGIYISPQDETKGQVNFGYFNDKKYGAPGEELQWFPVVPTDDKGYGYWLIDSSQMIISTIDYTGTERYLSYTLESAPLQGRTLLDSGTPSMIFTQNVADTINEWYKSKYNATSNFNFIPCSGGHPLTMSLKVPGTKKPVSYRIPYSSLAAKLDSGKCYSLIRGGAEQYGMSTFGSPFHQAAYIAHDKEAKKMGFIPLNPKLMSTKSFWSF
ncbi:Type I transmembrane sorting receptor [Rhizoclosmatium sp. JEL0117]|nr:Type I transmembrane sorting receptor [Rhizoclosmatium sp. JEL0117]